ncbi:helix-turn-helix transcriptional regulator [Klebsiella pneumoniae]
MEKLLSFNQVMDITGYSRPRIYELIKQGLFPRNIKIGASKVAFIESEVNDWVQNKIATSLR